MRRLIPVLMALMLVLALPLAMLSPVIGDSNSGARVDESIYRIRTTYTISNTGAYSAYNVKVSVRVGVDSSSPYQDNLNYLIEPAASTVRRDSAGNIYAELCFEELRSGEKRTIAVDRYFANSGIDFQDNIYNVKGNSLAYESDPALQQFVQPSDKIESNSSEIKKKLRGFDLKKSPVALAKDIYDFVNLHIDYDSSPKYANKGALSGLLTGKGVCDEYASLFTALCRAAGIPSRVVSGYWIDDTVKANEWKDVSGKRHAWSEFYVDGVGWIPVEPTLMYTLNGVRTPSKDYFARIKADDKHIITGYSSKNSKSELNMQYSCIKDTTVTAKFGEEKLIRVDRYYSKAFFSDISSSWARECIQRLYTRGILFARKNDMFEPTGSITRAEFAAYLVNSLGLDSEGTSGRFKDVASNHSLHDFIYTAAAKGLIKGDDQGNFRPDESISRQDAAVIMERALKLMKKNTGGQINLDFADKNKISPYAYDSVRLIYKLNIMTGKPEKLFDPKGATTREEAAKIIDNFVRVLE